MTELIVYRPPSTPLITLLLDDSSIYVKKLMAEWNVSTTYVSPTVVDFHIGDFVTIGTDNFYLARLPDVEKLNNSTFRYSLVFQSVFSELQTRLNFSTDGLTEYDYTGTADDFLTNLVALVDDLGWTKGVVDTTLPINISFSNEYCSASLLRIAEAFKLEYEIVGRVINLKAAIGTTTALTFQYGQGKGLYNISRQQVQDQNILTKVWGFGGTRNIAYDYRNRSKRLVFETTVGSHRYLTKNTELYGIIEGQFTDDTIFPQRTGTLTGADINFDVADPYDFIAATSYVEDTTIDFDINDYLLKDQEAKIVFKTGDLAGIECVIIRYDNATKRIYFNAYVDPNDAYTLPRYNEGTPIQPEIGDTYTLVDIKMPQSYIDTAEAALQAATQTFINENSVPMVVYSVALDPQYVKTIAAPKVGDKVTIVDADLGINALIRISGLEYPLTNPNKITATIADFVPYTLQERIIKQTVTNKKETIFVDRKAALLARTNTLRQNQLRELIFDTDNYFDTGNIRPLSIETAFMSVGFKSSDFWLSNVVITTNVGGNANSMNVSAGSLVHLQITIPSVGFTWVIGTPLTATSLTPASAYYLYAKCSKTALTGEWILSTSQITVEQVSGYYHFYCGNLFAVSDGRRDFDFVKGMTYIVGDTIKSGTIQSIDAQNYFNLTEGKFRIGNATTSLDFNVTTPNVLTLKGALVQTSAGTIPLLTFVGAYDAGVTYEKGNQVTYGGSSWTWINTTPAAGHTPAEDAYWTASAVKGATGETGATGATGPQGIQGSAGIDGTDGASLYTWLKYADTPTTGMSDSPDGKTYMGIAYNKTSPTESTTYSDYAWSLIKATDGINGVDGIDGVTTYTWVKYGTSAEGAGINDSPVGMTYIGLAFNKTTATESTTPSDYAWSLIKGADGTNGTNGADGVNGTNGTDGVSILFQGEYASVAALIADKGALQAGWSYRNTTDSPPKSYVYYPTSWYQMTIDGVAGANGTNGTNGTNGLSIVWKGDLATPPADPVENWVYRDTDNGYVYIYNGSAWELMVLDGSDGAAGAAGTNGTDGWSVYITYNDSPLGTPPASPTGDGSTDGWHTAPNEYCTWMSQKVTASITSDLYSDTLTTESGDFITTEEGDTILVGSEGWGVPIAIKGANGLDGIDGNDGVNGADGPSLVYRGLFSATAIYHYTDVNRDIVKYGDSWYLFKSKLNNNTAAAWGDGSRWEIFGGNFESIATGLLFADRATIDNLYVSELATAASGARITINEQGTGQQYCVYDASGNLKVIIKPTPISSIATIEAGAATETDSPTKTTSGSLGYTWTNEEALTYIGVDASTEFVISLDAEVLDVALENITITSGYTGSQYGTAEINTKVYLAKYINSALVKVGLVSTNNSTPAIIHGMTAGTYRLWFEATFTAIPYAESLEDPSASIVMTADWDYTTGTSFIVTTSKVIAQTEIGTDGFCSVWAADNYFHFSNAGLKIKGAVNMQGVLGSGTSSSTGSLSNVIGSIESAVKDSTGIYTITHNLGFSTYMVMITPITSNAKLNPVITSKADNTVTIKIVDASNDTATDTSFDILIIGNNV